MEKTLERSDLNHFPKWGLEIDIILEAIIGIITSPCLAALKIKDYIASFNRNNCRAYFVLISHVVFNEKIFPEKFDYIIMKNHHIIQISKMSLLYQ